MGRGEHGSGGVTIKEGVSGNNITVGTLTKEARDRILANQQRAAQLNNMRNMRGKSETQKAEGTLFSEINKIEDEKLRNIISDGIKELMDIRTSNSKNVKTKFEKASKKLMKNIKNYKNEAWDQDYYKTLNDDEKWKYLQRWDKDDQTFIKADKALQNWQRAWLKEQKYLQTKRQTHMFTK